MRYVSITSEEKRLMLGKMGAARVEDLFSTIPESLRLRKTLDIPKAAAETDILKYFKSLAEQNACTEKFEYFLGAGAYNHFIPTIIDSIISRAEFYTSYTPYQPEISQGTLQAIFEFQTLICQLTGMEVANASLYEGSSALAEAVLMAARIRKRQKVLLCESLHPEYRRVLQTYVANLDIELEDVPFTESGRLDVKRLEELLNEDHAAVVVQSPNFFGVIEELEAVAPLSHKVDALSIVVVTEAISLGLLKAPGELGADIVVGEGQSLGIPLGFGGPYLGIFATKDEYKRQMPGRLVGQTVDSLGRRGFVLTLATREQHIRREKATSNICTNQGLCALIAAVFLATLGKRGIRELAEQNLKKAFHLRKLLGDSLAFSGPTFNEMVVCCAEDPKEINRRLFREGIIGGLPLGRYFPERSNQMLVCVTEQNSRQKIERCAEVLKSVEVTL
ncbi:aminomethyl-transferring glycine dehydrogenase subunit GcvPA [Acidobacteria bacterium AH-259-A15]|nr:aminomethyl-transferring glycine dehydrogenase subunit GcvPA [Acidobacteria bacterium AH-259-A15]